MTVAFEPRNLDAAVTAVIEEAGRQERDGLHGHGLKVDLTNREQVRTYLKGRVLAVYARAEASAEGIQIARIEDIPYRGIGFVFEPHGDVIMHPGPEGAEDGSRVDHLAVFWANLSA
ncbi:hypothetical protein OKW34_000215 [Paraburkholderia youngii]|uniref:hypothetical protein n=1 Tax=Paraburkholderia youngii TaxID=2782701 RepID=UPI003D1BDDBF